LRNSSRCPCGSHQSAACCQAWSSHSGRYRSDRFSTPAPHPMYSIPSGPKASCPCIVILVRLNDIKMTRASFAVPFVISAGEE
jgi:hypothetical protein